MNYTGLEVWGDLIMTLDDFMQKEDLFILQSSREGTLSWRPGLDRLPGIFVNRYPQSNFIAVYPSEGDYFTKESLRYRQTRR